MLVVTLAKETSLPALKTAVHSALSCYLPADFAPAPVSLPLALSVHLSICLSQVSVLIGTVCPSVCLSVTSQCSRWHCLSVCLSVTSQSYCLSLAICLSVTSRCCSHTVCHWHSLSVTSQCSSQDSLSCYLSADLALSVVVSCCLYHYYYYHLPQHLVFWSY